MSRHVLQYTLEQEVEGLVVGSCEVRITFDYVPASMPTSDHPGDNEAIEFQRAEVETSAGVWEPAPADIAEAAFHYLEENEDDARQAVTDDEDRRLGQIEAWREARDDERERRLDR